MESTKKSNEFEMEEFVFDVHSAAHRAVLPGDLWGLHQGRTGNKTVFIHLNDDSIVDKKIEFIDNNTPIVTVYGENISMKEVRNIEELECLLKGVDVIAEKCKKKTIEAFIKMKKAGKVINKAKKTPRESVNRRRSSDKSDEVVNQLNSYSLRKKTDSKTKNIKKQSEMEEIKIKEKRNLRPRKKPNQNKNASKRVQNRNYKSDDEGESEEEYENPRARRIPKIESQKEMEITEKNTSTNEKIGLRPPKKASIVEENTESESEDESESEEEDELPRTSRRPIEGTHCIVLGCGNSHLKTRQNLVPVYYYRFPRKDILVKKWLTALNIDTKNISLRTSRVCSDHFKIEDFQKPFSSGKKMLKNKAVPSLHLSILTSKRNISKPQKRKSMSNKKILLESDDETQSKEVKTEVDHEWIPDVISKAKKTLEAIKLKESVKEHPDDFYDEIIKVHIRPSYSDSSDIDENDTVEIQEPHVREILKPVRKILNKKIGHATKSKIILLKNHILPDKEEIKKIVNQISAKSKKDSKQLRVLLLKNDMKADQATILSLVEKLLREKEKNESPAKDDSLKIIKAIRVPGNNLGSVPDCEVITASEILNSPLPPLSKISSPEKNNSVPRSLPNDVPPLLEFNKKDVKEIEIKETPKSDKSIRLLTFKHPKKPEENKLSIDISDTQVTECFDGLSGPMISLPANTLSQSPFLKHCLMRDKKSEIKIPTIYKKPIALKVDVKKAEKVESPDKLIGILEKSDIAYNVPEADKDKKIKKTLILAKENKSDKAKLNVQSVAKSRPKFITVESKGKANDVPPNAKIIQMKKITPKPPFKKPSRVAMSPMKRKFMAGLESTIAESIKNTTAYIKNPKKVCMVSNVQPEPVQNNIEFIKSEDIIIEGTVDEINELSQVDEEQPIEDLSEPLEHQNIIYMDQTEFLKMQNDSNLQGDYMLLGDNIVLEDSKNYTEKVDMLDMFTDGASTSNILEQNNLENGTEMQDFFTIVQKDSNDGYDIPEYQSQKVIVLDNIQSIDASMIQWDLNESDKDQQDGSENYYFVTQEDNLPENQETDEKYLPVDSLEIEIVPDNIEINPQFS